MRIPHTQAEYLIRVGMTKDFVRRYIILALLLSAAHMRVSSNIGSQKKQTKLNETKTGVCKKSFLTLLFSLQIFEGYSKVDILFKRELFANTFLHFF
jgi:hypothetical protein